MLSRASADMLCSKKGLCFLYFASFSLKKYCRYFTWPSKKLYYLSILFFFSWRRKDKKQQHDETTASTQQHPLLLLLKVGEGLFTALIGLFSLTQMRLLSQSKPSFLQQIKTEKLEGIFFFFFMMTSSSALILSTAAEDSKATSTPPPSLALEAKFCLFPALSSVYVPACAGIKVEGRVAHREKKSGGGEKIRRGGGRKYLGHRKRKEERERGDGNILFLLLHFS